MPKHFMMLIIGLFFGAGAGFLLAAANDVTLTGHDHLHDHDATAPETHDHSKRIELAGDGPIPTLEIALTADGSNAWNLHLITTNFRFAPDRVNMAHAHGEGHAHVYVDGIKTARIYGPWFHLSDLPEDTKEIRVTLNANSHEVLAVNDVLIEAAVSLDQ